MHTKLINMNVALNFVYLIKLISLKCKMLYLQNITCQIILYFFRILWYISIKRFQIITGHFLWLVVILNTKSFEGLHEHVWGRSIYGVKLIFLSNHRYNGLCEVQMEGNKSVVILLEAKCSMYLGQQFL